MTKEQILKLDKEAMYSYFCERVKSEKEFSDELRRQLRDARGDEYSLRCELKDVRRELDQKQRKFADTDAQLRHYQMEIESGLLIRVGKSCAW